MAVCISQTWDVIGGSNAATIYYIRKRRAVTTYPASSDFIPVHFDFKGKENDYPDKKINLKAQFRGKPDLKLLEVLIHSFMKLSPHCTKIHRLFNDFIVIFHLKRNRRCKSVRRHGLQKPNPIIRTTEPQWDQLVLQIFHRCPS